MPREVVGVCWQRRPAASGARVEQAVDACAHCLPVASAAAVYVAEVARHGLVTNVEEGESNRAVSLGEGGRLHAGLVLAEDGQGRHRRVGDAHGVHGRGRERPCSEMAHQLPRARDARFVGPVGVRRAQPAGGHPAPVVRAALLVVWQGKDKRLHRNCAKRSRLVDGAQDACRVEGAVQRAKHVVPHDALRGIVKSEAEFRLPHGHVRAAHLRAQHAHLLPRDRARVARHEGDTLALRHVLYLEMRGRITVLAHPVED